MSLPPVPLPRRISHHPDTHTLAQAISNIMIQDRAPSTVKKYASSFLVWQKWAEATSGPELACYLVHLLQTTKTLASIQTVAFGAHQKTCFPSSLQHTTVKQIFEECQRILDSSPKNPTHSKPGQGIGAPVWWVTSRT